MRILILEILQCIPVVNPAVAGLIFLDLAKTISFLDRHYLAPAFDEIGARMPKIKIIVVGNTKSSFLKEGEQFYLERLRRYTDTEWVEVKPQKVRKGRSSEEILAIEGQSIEKKFLSRDHITALDIRGKEYDSEGLAEWVERLSLSQKSLCFVIGGPLGLSKKILHSADEILSLSKLTLTHEMSRLLLLEQLYRAYTIIRGEKYHK